MINYLYFVIGGLSGIVVGRKFFKSRQYVKGLEEENRILRVEKEELKTKISQNSQNIVELKTAVSDLGLQVVTCLELLSSISTIRNAEEFKSTYVATRRFFKYWGFQETNDTSTDFYEGD
jgi:hypothetical protein